MGLILRLVKEYKKTVLMVTHDPVVAARADVTLHLEKGVLVESWALCNRSPLETAMKFFTFAPTCFAKKCASSCHRLFCRGPLSLRLLAVIKNAFSGNLDVVGADRLVVINRTSIIQPLPLSYDDKIRRIPG